MRLTVINRLSYDVEKDQGVDPRVLELCNQVEINYQQFYACHCKVVHNLEPMACAIKANRVLKASVVQTRAQAVRFTTEYNYEMNRLSRWRLVPPGLADIVIEYVGWTDPQTIDSYWQTMHDCVVRVEEELLQTVESEQRSMLCADRMLLCFKACFFPCRIRCGCSCTYGVWCTVS